MGGGCVCGLGVHAMWSPPLPHEHRVALRLSPPCEDHAHYVYSSPTERAVWGGVLHTFNTTLCFGHGSRWGRTNEMVTGEDPTLGERTHTTVAYE